MEIGRKDESGNSDASPTHAASVMPGVSQRVRLGLQPNGHAPMWDPADARHVEAGAWARLGGLAQQVDAADTQPLWLIVAVTVYAERTLCRR